MFLISGERSDNLWVDDLEDQDQQNDLEDIPHPKIVEKDIPSKNFTKRRYHC